MKKKTIKERILLYNRNKLVKIIKNSWSYNECLIKMNLGTKWHKQYHSILKEKIKQDKITEKLLRKNPNLNESYFKTINTKTKAYWLGFLAADGYITKNQVVLDLAHFDDCLIFKFIKDVNADPKNIVSYKRQYKNYKVNTSKSIYINNKNFASHLINLGFVSPKSYNLHFPNLRNMKLELAFLQGYFDGDGSRKSCNVTTCSKDFLEQIIKKFNVPFLITKQKNNCYKLTLGVELVRKMNENYKDSLERKRLPKKIIKINRIKKKAKIGNYHHKTEKLDKNIIRELVKTKPLTSIAKMFNYSDNGIKKFCKRNNIKIPQKWRFEDRDQYVENIKKRYKDADYLKKIYKSNESRRTHDYEKIWKMYKNRTTSIKELIKKIGIHRSKFYMIIKKMKKIYG